MVDNNYQTMLNRLIEEKYTFTYKKLAVPMSMRSPYWKYFGFPATEDGNILTKVKIICTICKAQIAYNKNTSNLRMHLQNRHPDELAELVAVHPPESRPSAKLSSYQSAKPPLIPPKWPPNERPSQHRNITSSSTSQPLPTLHGTYNQRIQRQSQFPGSLVLKVSPPSGDDSKAPRKRKFHRMLESTNSGFVKQGSVYATSVDGSIEIEGDLQFISDPTINMSFADEEYENQVPNIQILGSATAESPVVVVHNESNNQSESAVSQPSNRIRIEGISTMESNHAKSICDAITDMIVTDLMPPDIVEKNGFQSLVATLRSPCEIPSTARLANELLPALYAHVKNTEKTALAAQQGNIGLSLEEWTSREGETMVTVSVHYLHKSSTKLESRVLSTFHSPYDITHNWTTDVDNLLTDWQIDPSRVTAVVSATDQLRLLDAFRSKGISVVHCLLYTIQVAARECFDMVQVAHLLGKVRVLLSAFKKNLDDESTLRIQDQVFQLDEPLVLDYPAVWLTTYHMIEQLQMFRNLKPTVLESGSEHLRELWLADEDWDTLEELLAVLEPLRVAVLTLAEERVPLLSLLEPLLWQLVDSHLQTKEEDSNFVQSLKRKLAEQLSSRYSDYSCRLVLRTATQLDPRFKGLPHSDEDVKNSVVEQLHKSLESHIEEDVSSKEVSTTPSKKNRLSGLLGKLCPDKTTSERAKSELDQFTSVASAALDSCPLEWWSKNAGLCPKLVNIARRYMCLLSCAIPLQRIPHTQQTAFHQARSNLSHDLGDVLLFLNANYSS